MPILDQKLKEEWRAAHSRKKDVVGDDREGRGAQNRRGGGTKKNRQSLGRWPGIEGAHRGVGERTRGRKGEPGTK